MNLVFNGNFRLWGEGTTTVPTGWYVAAAGGGTLPSILQQSNGQYGDYSVKVTRNNANAFLAQDLKVINNFDLAQMVGQVVTYAVMIKWTAPNNDTFANATMSDAIYESHTEMHRGFGETRLCIGRHIIQSGASQLILNATVKRSDQGSGTADAEVIWAGAWLGDQMPWYWEPNQFDNNDAALLAASMADQTSTGTFFIGSAGADAQEDFVSFVMPYNGVITDMRARSGATPGTGETFVYTLRSNGTDKALTCTTSGASQSSSGSNHVYVPASNNVSIKCVASSGATATRHRVSLSVARVP